MSGEDVSYSTGAQFSSMSNILCISKWVGSIWIYCRTAKYSGTACVIRLVDQLKARDRLKCRKTTRLP